jgi:hypothetical protein
MFGWRKIVRSLITLTLLKEDWKTIAGTLALWAHYLKQSDRKEAIRNWAALDNRTI